ncbi:MAG: DMT family transporter [Burkholderiaceae bacterium]
MLERKTHLDSIAITLLIACCLFWGAQQVLVKATIAELPPIFQASLRFGGATLLLLVWCKARAIPLWLRDGSLLPGLVAGFLFAIEFGCIYGGLQFTSASRLTVFTYTSPFWVAVLVPLWVPTEKVGRMQWLGLVLAFCGVTVALSDGLSQGGVGQWHGDALAIAAGLFWGLTTVVIRTTMLARLSAEKLLFYQVGVSTLILPWVSRALGETWQPVWSSFAITSMVIQTVLGAFISYLAWMWLLGRYPATKISGFVFLTPVFALLIGSFWLGEAITLPLVVGLSLVAAGMLLVNRKS